LHGCSVRHSASLRFEAEVRDKWYESSQESDARRIKLNVGGQVGRRTFCKTTVAREVKSFPDFRDNGWRPDERTVFNVGSRVRSRARTTRVHRQGLVDIPPYSRVAAGRLLARITLSA
jgi:hypothetical protein